MARIRTVKPEFFRHRRLYLAEMESALPLRIAFAGLWCCADREGRFKWEPEELKLDCLPYDDVDFARVLDALTTRRFIVRYEVDGRTYGHIPGFRKHQVVNNRESASTLPEPPNEINILPTREARDADARGTRHDPAQVEVEGKWEGKEGRSGARSARRTSLPEGFTISDRVRTWAHGKGYHDHLEQHFEKFISYVKARGAQYADWDEALMGCIRDDWGDIRRKAPSARPPGANGGQQSPTKAVAFFEYPDGQLREMADYPVAEHLQVAKICAGQYASKLASGKVKNIMIRIGPEQRRFTVQELTQ